MSLNNNGRKDDQGKLRWDLLPLDVVEKIVEVYTFGAEKYAPNSWQNLEDGRERYYAALLRHLCAWRKGEIDRPREPPQSSISLRVEYFSINLF